MILENVFEVDFLERENRFVWVWLLNNKKIKFHIWDTWRLKELLFKWNKILVQKLSWWNRKYNFRLIWAKGLLWDYILLNSLLHSALIREYLTNKWISFKPEIKVGDSKIDFLIEDNLYVEIKGCSLIKKENWKFIAMFPDAPTTRWQKHLQELIQLTKNWKKAQIWFLLTNNVNIFKLNIETDPKFSKLFYEFLNLWWKVDFLYCKLEYKENRVSLVLNKKEVEILV